MTSGASRWLTRRAVALLVAAPGAVLTPSEVTGQETGFLTGVVMDDRTGTPLRDAKVVLLGGDLEARTGESGEFLLDGVPLGALSVRFEAEGYVSVVEEMQLSAADFLQVRLSKVEAVLEEILVLAGRRPREGGDAVAPQRDEDSWRSVMDLLEDQVPGVIVSRGGGLGVGATVYLRGAGSFQSDMAPHVYLDGVRIAGGNASPALRFLQGGTQRGLHVLDVIRADVVERVRVLKGAAATTAFPMAANGVILIETNRGGPPAER